MKKTYVIAGITGIVLLLSTIGIYAYMINGNGMMGYGNMMNSYYANQAQPSNQNMMQGYTYESMDKMHDSMVASIQDPGLRDAMNKMHDSYMGSG